MQWPEIFETGTIDGLSDAKLCADGLSAWAGCMAGNKQPLNFGIVMAKIANKLGILGTPDSFSQWGEEHGFYVRSNNGFAADAKARR